jgi:hypothetical protein
MNNATINTDYRIYLVKFQHRLTECKFIISSADDLVELLKQGDRAAKGIESIKTFDPATDKFVRISKADFLRFNNWQTEAMEYLNNYYYFKK